MLRSPAGGGALLPARPARLHPQPLGPLLGDRLLRLLGSLDLIREEEKPRFPGPGPTRAYVYSGMEREYERFSPDKDWMPNVVMMAKIDPRLALPALDMATARDIRTLDAIPDEELDALASRGFNALWLIGLWERSQASAEIKRRCGNPEAAASAYSLFDYEIAEELGGWPALERLREKCGWRGITPRGRHGPQPHGHRLGLGAREARALHPVRAVPLPRLQVQRRRPLRATAAWASGSRTTTTTAPTRRSSSSASTAPRAG